MTRKSRIRSRRRVYALALALLVLAGCRVAEAQSPGVPDVAVQTAPTPTRDRLATPVMPESPTQIDVGRNLYYYHCMPCHGDRGQGLTDEWRAVWVHDHQNCWAPGCHSGRAGEEGFYIPHDVPPVSDSPQVLAHFATAEDLFVYLRETHPPQRPGTLSDDENWALTAFVLHENGRLSAIDRVGPGAAASFNLHWGVVIVATGGILLTALVFLRTKRR